MTSGPAEQYLRGAGVLVTRPRHQADALCDAIRQKGGNAISFPVLEIRGPDDARELEQCAAELDDLDWAIFVSANAVDKALGYLLSRRKWPDTVGIAVIGKRSAEELHRFGLEADAQPQWEFNSEGLLALPQMHDVRGRRIVIFRGNGGREYLAEMLRQRGANVRYVEAYRRICPRADSSELLKLWQSGGVDVVLINSVESLENLVEMLGRQGHSLLVKTPLIVASERIVAVAQRLGFTAPQVISASATDAAVMDALFKWKNQSD
ncbi:MAG: uroporphyrinogen-III synthase [Thiogranum sp.]|nr:uroporphyrinogen-III synthase [Thiogranum sp.]